MSPCIYIYIKIFSPSALSAVSFDWDMARGNILFQFLVFSSGRTDFLEDYLPMLCAAYWPGPARVRSNKSVKNAEIWNYLPDLGEDINFNQLQLIFIIDFLLSPSLGLIYLSCRDGTITAHAQHKLTIVNCYMCKVSKGDSKIWPPECDIIYGHFPKPTYSRMASIGCLTALTSLFTESRLMLFWSNPFTCDLESPINMSVINKIPPISNY